MDSKTVLARIAKLETQVQDLETELFDVKRERDDFRQELSRNREKLAKSREKVAKLTSFAEAQAVEIRDFERRLQRVQRGKENSEEDDSYNRSSLVMKQKATIEDSDIETMNVSASFSETSLQRPTSHQESIVCLKGSSEVETTASDHRQTNRVKVKMREETSTFERSQRGPHSTPPVMKLLSPPSFVSEFASPPAISATWGVPTPSSSNTGVLPSHSHSPGPSRNTPPVADAAVHPPPQPTGKSAAKLTSVTEPRAVEMGDLERQLKRDEKHSAGKTVKGNSEPAIIEVKLEGTSKDSDIVIPTLSSGSQKPSNCLKPSSIALSGDHTQTTYSQTYQEQSTSNGNIQSWQPSSPPIAARGTDEDQRFNRGSYYQPNIYPASYSQDAFKRQVPGVDQVPPKRRLPDGVVVPSNAKRAKTSAPQAPGLSKRERKKKKRSEAAQIAAQNAKLMSQSSHMSEKGKEKASDGVSMQIVPSVPGDDFWHAELQNTKCVADKYKSDTFPRCVACTRRWKTDSCRFQGIRFFIRNAQRNVVGVSFSGIQKPAELPSMKFPNEWNEELSGANIKRTKITIACALLPTLRKELKHLRASTIHRPRERQVRATCDTCLTSIFSSSWLCRLCGREACAECYATISELTAERPSADLTEKQADSNPFFLQCTKRTEHQKLDFSPVSRFEDKELSNTIKEIEELLTEEGIEQEAGVPRMGPRLAVQNGASSSSKEKTTGSVPSGSSQYKSALDLSSVHDPSRPPSVSITPGTQLPEGYPPCTTTKPFNPGTLSMLTLRTPAIPIRRFADSALTQETFPLIWALGEPLIVTDLLQKFRIEWTPEYFTAKYGQQGCRIVECQTDMDKGITAGEFFAEFGQYKDRKECWKLKDWPPSMDFKTAFPELYEDFNNAVPVPSYVRRDGVLNIASHFPADTVAPDLGPKMYNAMATTQAAGSKGSTRLHMAMADALHIMTYASPAPDGSLGCAAWDIYRAEDSDKLREFLTEHVRAGHGKAKIWEAAAGPRRGGAVQGQDLAGANDPIHEQSFYLDEELRASLYGETGVMSYRFYQRPGDAVFIPAGCAYQVANLADCVTVAVDFVSPENVTRCERLTREFREQNQRKVWKEDVLQLRTMMWFAWLSCRRQEEFEPGQCE